MKGLTKYELEFKLEMLKEILRNYDENKFYNISFINIDALYYHLDIYNNTKFKIKEIIESIDIYIPLSIVLDNELIQVFETALNCNNLDEFNYFKTIFYKNSIRKFLYLIKNIKTKEDWKKFLNSFEQIRKIT